ncbi:DeoR/GlpR transcriptional regulator [Romboutsia ilealis]|uniref:DeoR/GlpR transcriptional regulator n=1 Tax=Romboutsia faecis TaxID=2764597 RepID=A0ABR7JKG7_9FIRM|nr:DeoR/GlpR family DNA-binding transcription regulator [Romboutsia faecis]MBC5995424.1 DeoR/GlpR transcriptional regulator [Romboutsia faecis]MRN24333.1 DeoR/GlpR transcriptional regulator [Romboutsia ilealis]
MFQLDRHKQIYEYILKNKNATVNELAEIFDVATMTIRRDLDKMERDRLLTRVFGGAVIGSNMVKEEGYEDKEKSNIDEKVKIAKEAAKLVSDNSIIILDAGTTCMEIAKELVERKNLKIITTDILIAAYLMKYENIEVYCTGGRIQSNIGSCIDSHAMEFLNNINADICFVGASAINEDLDLFTFLSDKSKVKKAMMNSSQHRVLVTDNSKFNKRSFAKICSLKDFEIVITNEGLDEDIKYEIANKGVNIKII